MRKIQTFWHVFRHSLVPLDYYYHTLRTTPLFFSIKYFVALILVVVLVGTGINTALLVAQYPPEKLTYLVEKLEKDYPDDLVIRINNMGRLSTNYDKPFVLFSPLETNPQPLIVVDAKAHKDKIYEYGARVLMAERYMVVRFHNNLYTIMYQLNEPMKLDAVDVMNVSSNLVPLLESYWFILLSIVVLVLLIAPIVLTLYHMLLLAIVSLVMFVLVRFGTQKKSIHLLKVYQLSLHTVTAPLIIGCILCTFRLVPSVPYWYILLNVAFLAGGIFEAYFEKKSEK